MQRRPPGLTPPDTLRPYPPYFRSTLLDYAAGVPSAQAIKAAGYAGAIRYVSDRRPGADWMVGKPVLARETDALTAAGLQVVSCYQFGKGGTARSEEHTSELQSLMRISYAVFCLKQKNKNKKH